MFKKLSSTIIVALVIVSCGSTYLLDEYIHHRITKTTNNTITSITGSPSQITADSDIESSTSYRFIKPLIKPGPKEESAILSQLKTRLSSYIENLKKTHKLISASVYLRYYGHGIMMNLNPNETYSPGSMFKVVNLLLYLKLSEQNPGLLEKTMFNGIPANTVRPQTYNSKQIEYGKTYTVKELLKYMIEYSDNTATTLLMTNMDSKVYLQMVNDLKIPFMQTNGDILKMTTYSYSYILKLLYKSSYLSFKNSEYALSLLNQSDFKIGLLKGLPDGITVAHKFGESGTPTEPELHESGLVYMDYGPYLITIMTRGYNINDLPPVISTISKMVYDDVSQIVE